MASDVGLNTFATALPNPITMDCEARGEVVNEPVPPISESNPTRSIPIQPTCVELRITKAQKDGCIVFGEGCDLHYLFLDNDYPSSFEFGGRQYGSVTAAYEAQKFYPKFEFIDRFTRLSPKEALSLSAEKHLDKPLGWHDKRLETMLNVLRAKFGQNPGLQKLLLLTADAYLLSHTPFKGMDPFWSDDSDGSGANQFGRALMQVRKELGGLGEAQLPSNFQALLPKNPDLEKPCISALNKTHEEVRGEIDELNAQIDDEDYRRNSAIARRHENLSFTRFPSNNFPYDQTLVPLSSGRYINASFILGKQFIGMQSPMTHTTEDFWSMVDEHHVPIVIMLNRLGDPGDQIYFPFSLDDKRQYGSIRLQLSEAPLFITESSWRHAPHEEEPHAIIHRKVLLQKEKEQPREIHHFQYQNWRDFSAGNDRAAAYLVKTVHQIQEMFPKSPVVVHCHAGVGRTAALITLLEQYQVFCSGGQLDIKRSVVRQRSPVEGRCNSMMQSTDQYAFCYRVLRLLTRV